MDLHSLLPSLQTWLPDCPSFCKSIRLLCCCFFYSSSCCSWENSYVRCGFGGQSLCLRACPWNEARNETAHVTNGNCAGKEGEEPGFRDDLCSPGRGVPVSAAASLSWQRCACIRFSLHILLETLHRVHRHLPSDDFLVSAEHTSTQTSHAKCCLEKSRNLDT